MYGWGILDLNSQQSIRKHSAPFKTCMHRQHASRILQEIMSAMNASQCTEIQPLKTLAK